MIWKQLKSGSGVEGHCWWEWPKRFGSQMRILSHTQYAVYVCTCRMQHNAPVGECSAWNSPCFPQN